MRVKRFVGDTMQAAVALVRAEFGQDALIINTRKVRRRGILAWFRKPQYEVVAALEVQSKDTKAVLSRPLQRPSALSMDTQVRPEGAARSVSLARAPRESSIQDNWSGPLKQLHRHLLEQDVTGELARRLVEEVETSALDDDSLRDVQWVAQAAERCLAKMVPCVDPSGIGQEGRIIPLIGPTGVGKTTTIAKLAANFALLANKQVAIVTADTYRIAAVEQLKTYADLIGVPLEVAYTPEELSGALDLHRDKDLVFVDTAGRSQRHEVQMQELRAFLGVIDNPLTHLVLSATTKLSDAAEITMRFGSIPFERIIITKVDETSTFGTMLSLMVQTSKKLAYLTNGQNVPDDIEVALSSRVADLIMRGRV